MQKIDRIHRSAEERNSLTALTTSSKPISAKKVIKARALLLADESDSGPSLRDVEIMKATEMKPATLVRLLEKHFDPPAGLIERTDARRSPLKVVGDESHLHFLSVDLDEHHNPEQTCGILLPAFRCLQDDEIIPQDFTRRLANAFLHDSETHVVLRPGDPGNAATSQSVKVFEIEVGLVKLSDFAILQTCAQLLRPGVIVVTSLLNDGAGG